MISYSKFNLEALELFMKNNFFPFNGKIYHLTKVVETGITDVVFNSQTDFLKMIKLWKTYIDNILVLFKGSKQDFEEMVSWLNSIMPGVTRLQIKPPTAM